MAKITSKNNSLLRDSRNKVSPKVYNLLMELVNDDREELAEVVLKIDYLIEYANSAVKAKDYNTALETVKRAEERVKLIKEKPAYGNIICRCEMITEGEIIDAIHRPLGAKSLDGVKRRTRAGMGRCQAGFCSPRTMEILARELEIPMSEITKSGGKSRIIVGVNKEDI